MFVLLAAVNLPCASTVKVDTAVAEPYEPAVTAVLSRLIVTVSVEDAVAVSPVPPEIVSVSPLVIVCGVPASPAMVNVVEAFATAPST